MLLTLLIIIVYFARLSKYQSLSLKPEAKKEVGHEFFVYIKDSELVCQKIKKYNFEFYLPKCSDIKLPFFARVNGTLISNSDNKWSTKNKLIIQDITNIDFDYLSVRQMTAVLFGNARSFQLRAKGLTRDILLNFLTFQTSLLLSSMLWGSTSDPNMANLSIKMRNAGLSHVLAVSGFHLNYMFDLSMLILGACSLLVRRIRQFVFGSRGSSSSYLYNFRRMSLPVIFQRRKRGSLILLLFCVLFLGLYSLVVGAGASVLRAYISLIFRLLDRLLFKLKVNMILVLICVLVLMLLLNPFYLLEVGWQLSFMACFGLILQKQIIRHLPLSRAKKLEPAISVICVQLLTWPILVLAFEEFNFGTLISSIFLMPFIEFMFGISLWLLFVFGLNLVLSGQLQVFLEIQRGVFYQLSNWFDRALGLFQFTSLPVRINYVSKIGLLIAIYYLFMIIFIVQGHHVKQQK